MPFFFKLASQSPPKSFHLHQSSHHHQHNQQSTVSESETTMEENLKSLSLDYLNLLINGQAFSDVAFSVEGRIIHAHRCILAARSLFFRKFFSGPDSPPPAAGFHLLDSPRSPRASHFPSVIPVTSVGYEVFLLLLQYLYSGQVSVLPPKHEPRPNCGDRGCWHTHCSSAVDLALDTLAAARTFGVDQLALLTQKQLASTVEKASIEDVMRVLLASRKQEMQQLWTTCSHLVANSGLPPQVLAKHLPYDVIAKIDELRLNSTLARRSVPHPIGQHNLPLDAAAEPEDQQKIRRMRRALDCSDVELVKLMVMGERLNLDDALALHYAVQCCSRDVVKALLELGAADVNRPAAPAGKTPLHVAAEMVCPDMVAVLLDHHADPNGRTTDGVTPLDILRTLTSDFLFKGAIPGMAHIEPNKLRLCLELVQSAALVLSREEAAAAAAGGSGGTDPDTSIYPQMNSDHAVNSNTHTNNNNHLVSLGLDSRMVYLNLGMANAAHLGCSIGEESDDSGSNRSQGDRGIGSSSLYSPHHFP